MVLFANVKDDLKKKIVERLGVVMAKKPRTYIGIPAMRGKTKTTSMAF